MKGEDSDTLRVWLFAHDGFTRDAEALMREQSVLWSDQDDLNALLECVNLRTLPVIDDTSFS